MLLLSVLRHALQCGSVHGMLCSDELRRAGTLQYFVWGLMCVR
jgi:hypothetical protein